MQRETGEKSRLQFIYKRLYFNIASRRWSKAVAASESRGETIVGRLGDAISFFFFPIFSKIVHDKINVSRTRYKTVREKQKKKP